MDFEKPSINNFTIYSKSGCINCRKLKDLLKSKNINFIVVDCDEYLFEDKEFFLSFIKEYSIIEWKTFPIVFHNGKFIGGYNETIELVDKLTAFEFEV